MNVGISSEVCRARYDHITFAKERSRDSSHNSSSSGSSTGDDAASCRERRWLLELGAMTVLEAELETLSVDDGASTAGRGGRAEGGSSARERASYKSCLEAMLDEHYVALGGLDDNTNTSIPTSLLDTITKASSAAPPITISEKGCSDAFRPVEVSTMLDVLPGLMVERDPLRATAATLTARESPMVAAVGQAVASGAGGVGGGSGNGAEGGASGATTKPASHQGGDVSRGIPSLRRGNANSSDDVIVDAADRNDRRFSPTSGRSNGNNRAVSQPPETPQHQSRHGAQVAADRGPVNPYAVPPASRSTGRSTSSSSETTTPFPPSNVRGMARTPVQRFPGTAAGAGSDGRSSPSNGYENRAPPGDLGAGARNVFGGPSSGPVRSQDRSQQHHQQQHQQQQQQQQHQHQHQRHQQQATPRYGDRNPARGALVPAGRGGGGGGGGRDSHATADAWAAREPTPVRGGLFEAGGGMGPGQQQQQQGGNGAFKTARELRASDIAPGRSGGGRGNGNDTARRRGGEPQRSWDGRDSGRGGGAAGVWGGGGGSNHGQRVGGSSNSYSYNNNDGCGEYENGHGRYRGSSSSFDDEATTRGGQGPPIPPRLPNGPGLVRKRKFVPPGRLDNNNNGNSNGSGVHASGGGKFPGSAALGGRGGGNNGGSKAASGGGADDEEELPEELQHLEKAMVDKILQEVQQKGDPVTFDQIAGLEFAKKSVIELVCWPMERPDIFTGLRSLPKGLLLFGPPGTGKTLIGKAIAHQSGATFFSISASSLCSKWIGEGEKMVRTLFAVAGYHQPAVIFIDEVDSMLSMRSADENEASRRLKTEFLIQLDGAGTK
ncbi:unnamed protein product [Ectocarpus fasciculatus]